MINAFISLSKMNTNKFREDIIYVTRIEVENEFTLSNIYQ